MENSGGSCRRLFTAAYFVQRTQDRILAQRMELLRLFLEGADFLRLSFFPINRGEKPVMAGNISARGKCFF